jgi:hypothetical protein
MRDNKLVGTVSVLVTLSSCLAVVLSFSGVLGPSLDTSPHEAAGRVLARQARALLKPGGQITVIARDTAAFQNPATDLQLAAFRKELMKAGTAISSVQVIQIDPLRPTAVPSGDFFQCVKGSTRESVIVSLMGPPVFTEAQVAQLNEAKPAIVAFCPGPIRDQVNLRTLFAQGLLKAAVVSRRNKDIKRSPTRNEREAFDSRFVEVTSANLSALTSSSNPSP